VALLAFGLVLGVERLAVRFVAGVAFGAGLERLGGGLRPQLVVTGGAVAVFPLQVRRVEEGRGALLRREHEFLGRRLVLGRYRRESNKRDGHK